MATLEQVLPYILDNEKGMELNPNDLGGATNLGITISLLSAYLGRAATLAELKALTPATVAPIYKKYFYDPLRISELPLIAGICLMDIGVNRGCNSAVLNVQWALGIHQDGKLGDQTIQAIQKCDPQVFVLKFVTCLKDSYIKTVIAKPSQIEFLSGWLNRILKMFTLKGE